MSLYKQILCPIDGSPTSQRGMREAAAVAKAMGAKVHFFHVIDLQPALIGTEGGAVAMGALDALRKNGADIVKAAQKFGTDQGLDVTTGATEAVGSRVSDAILDEASRCKADLIVIGSHGRRGVRRLLLGSDAEAIARQAPCAVLLVHAG